MIPIVAVLIIGAAVTGTIIISGLLLFGASQPPTAADKQEFRPSPYQPMAILTQHAPEPDPDAHQGPGGEFSAAA